MFELRPELVRRIVWEASVVDAKYPHRFQLRRTDDGRLFWDGGVPVERSDFPVTVRYPAAYPGQAPVLETTLALPLDCPHVLARSGAVATLCWISPAARDDRRRWDPQRHTAATVMRAAQRWFLAYLVWQVRRKWPVRDAWDAAR